MLQELVQQIKNTVDDALSDVHTAVPAKIVSVDTSTGLATVLPVMKKVMANGTKVSYPQISGVPIVLPQGAGQSAFISFPVKAGDGCLLIISEQSLEYWLYGRETDTTLLHDITNAICIPGLYQTPPSSFADACNSSAVIVEAGNTRLTVKSGGVAVSGSLTVSGSLNVSGDTSLGGTLSTSAGATIGGSLSASSVTERG